MQQRRDSSKLNDRQSKMVAQANRKLKQPLFLSLLSTLIVALGNRPSQVQAHNLQQAQQHLDIAHQFSCGKLYYRTFHLDQQRNVLYVGAM